MQKQLQSDEQGKAGQERDPRVSCSIKEMKTFLPRESQCTRVSKFSRFMDAKDYDFPLESQGQRDRPWIAQKMGK